MPSSDAIDLADVAAAAQRADDSELQQLGQILQDAYDRGDSKTEAEASTEIRDICQRKFGARA